MKNSYLAYLESTVELQAYRIEQLETLIILERTYLNTIHGIQLGKRWLAKHEDQILAELMTNGALEHAVEALRKSLK
jgi:hypothetical protein